MVMFKWQNEKPLCIDKIIEKEEMRKGVHAVWEVDMFPEILGTSCHSQENRNHLHFENPKQGQMST